MILDNIKKIILLYKQPNMGYISCNSHLLLCRHNFDSSPQVLDSQKSEWKYTGAEEKQILDVLNTPTIEQLHEHNMKNNQIKWIQEHRSKIGSYENLNDLLLAKGMTMNIVKKLYKSIIAGGSNKIKESERSSLSIPTVPETIRENVNTILSLCVGANVISWAQLNRTSTVLNWDCSSFADMPENINLASLVPFAFRMSYSIPNSDIFLLKASQVIIQNNMNFPTYRATMQRHQLTASLISILGYREAYAKDNGTSELSEALKNKLFLLKPRVTSRLFNIQIGGEVVSSEKIVHSLLNKSSPMTKLPILPVNMSVELQSSFRQKNAYQREQMSKALLQSLTFLNLCILQNSASLRVKETKNKHRREKNMKTVTTDKSIH